MWASLSHVERLHDVRLSERDLVAVSLPPGPEWLDLVDAVWDADAALFPVDPRLPPVAAAALIRTAAPTVTLDPSGWTRREDGQPVSAGVTLVVHTSGTAGEPKLVEFDRGAVNAAVASSAVALGATPQDPWLCCLPPAHIGGLLVLLRGALLGAPVTVHTRFDPAAVAAERDAVFTSLVPTMLGRLLDAEVDLARYRAILVGGASLPATLRHRAEEVGVRIVETYGLTESCGGVVYDGAPLPGSEVRLDSEGGIELRGPTSMLGYRSDRVGTERAFTPDRWLCTGDVGEIGSDGRLRVVGRRDELIISGGEKVWPQEVERVLEAHPKVAEALVHGTPDAEWGQRVVAFVVPANPAEPPTLEELRDAVAFELPRHKAPRELLLVEQLPLTSSGKRSRRIGG